MKARVSRNFQLLSSMPASQKVNSTKISETENVDRLVQMIDGDGNFKAAELEQFVGRTGLSNCGNSYAVVGIMGPQSSGKSTLLNHLYHTKFDVMDADKGRNKTTQGIWVAKCDDEVPFIVLDIEGSDGRERGQDDTSFEKQSALFALAVANVVIINIWEHDVGREQAAGKPLLRIVFQAMMKIKTSPARKTTLLFVLRDKSKIRLEHLEKTLREGTEEIWDSVCKSIHTGARLSQFFNVEITALSSFEREEELFKKQVDQLRQRLHKYLSPDDRQGNVPASGFSFSAQKLWDKIKENEDLNLPAHQVMVAKFRCKAIAKKKFHQLSSDENWLALEREVQLGWTVGFGGSLSTIFGNYFSEYDKETRYFVEGVRNEYREELVSKAMKLGYPVYLQLLGHLRSKVLTSFKDDLGRLVEGKRFSATEVRHYENSAKLYFEQGCEDAAITHMEWDPSAVQEELCKDIDSEKASVYANISSGWKVKYKDELSKGLSKDLELAFKNINKNTWAEIRYALTHWTGGIKLLESAVFHGFELDLAKSHKLVQELRDYARNLVESTATERAESVQDQMKARYKALWKNGNAKKKDARFECLKLLSVMAAMRLDKTPDKIESKLLFAFMDKKGSPESLPATWAPEVSAKDILLPPAQCNLIWEKFRSYTKKESVKAAAQEIAVEVGYGVSVTATVVGALASVLQAL